MKNCLEEKDFTTIYISAIKEGCGIKLTNGQNLNAAPSYFF